MSNTPKIISNLGETSRNGIPLTSLLEVFPALHSSFLFLPSSFQQEACVYVWLSLNLLCCLFSGLVGWLCQLPFLFPGVPSMSNTPKITSNLGETSRNGIPLGSFLEVFPALHVSFLFLQSSFSQEACVYVWLSLVLSCFVHFLDWLGGCAKWHSTGLFPGSVPSLAFFLSISSIFFSARSMYLYFVGCGLWDFTWQITNLPDRNKYINYRKFLWFWNAMIYLHYCVHP